MADIETIYASTRGKLLILFLLLPALFACSGSGPPEPESTAGAQATATSGGGSLIPSQPPGLQMAAVPTLGPTNYPGPESLDAFPPFAYPAPGTPELPTPPTYPEPWTIPTPGPISATLQLVEDPSGEFSLRIPVEWKKDPNSESYTGEDGFFRMGYLPEMAYQQKASRVCIDLKRAFPGRWVSGGYSVQGTDFCSLKPAPGNPADAPRVILQNPDAPPEQHYAYLEADEAHMDSILAWLVFKNPAQSWEFPLYLGGPLRPQDQAFWAKTDPLPPGMKVVEYAVAQEEKGRLDSLYDAYSNDYPGEKVHWREDSSPTSRASTENVLENYGYHLVEGETVYSNRETFNLYRDGELVLGGIESTGHATTSASGEDFVTVLTEPEGKQWLLRKDGISPWDRDPFTYILADPIFLGEELIYPVWNPSGQVEILRGSESIYSIAVNYYASNPVKNFLQWEVDWLMETDGYLVQDEEVLNDTFGYEEIFGWRLLNGQPAYSFRKGPKVGISYGGKILPVSYDYVVHYGCCGYVGLNPRGSQNMVRFYGLRDGTWVDVEIGFEEGG
jgi:hypothetical protein